jgi:hypothetical protein
MVTVDTSSGKNTVVWQKTPGKNIKEYKVLKETTVSGVYSIIGTVPFSENGQYTDLGSEPTKHADRYKIATIDSSDLQIGLSNIHQTIHLAINQGLPGTYNLIWTPYVGFDYYTYYIYKGSSPGNLNLIDSLANTYIQYTDTAASVAYYQIGVRKSSPCIISKRKSGGEPFSQSISNLEDNLKYVGIKKVKSDLLIKVYPNPFNNEIVIESFIERPELFKIELFNVLGMKIYEYLTNKLISCNYKKVIHSYELTKASEMNILKVTVGDKIYFTKIIKR